MDLFINKTKDDASQCSFDEQDIQRCPFLRNISKPTNLSSSVNLPTLVTGAKGPVFEDGPNFDLAFKLFHGKDGIVPITKRSAQCGDERFEPECTPKFNPLAGKTATISLSALGLVGLFGFNHFFAYKSKKQNHKYESSGIKDHSSQGGNKPPGKEALSNEWLQTGNCPIAKSYRAVSNVLPLVAKTLKPPPGLKLRCPPAVVAARATLARTALVKNLRPQPLPAKMLVIATLGMAANVPLGVWREHTRKFSLSWFIAVHAAVPFIAMLRKAVVMPKTAMALTIAASILGQVIGSRAERARLKIIAGQNVTSEQITTRDLEEYSIQCGAQEIMSEGSHRRKSSEAGTSRANVCY